jgi:hypothetical protein
MEMQITGTMARGNYLERVSTLVEGGSYFFINPFEAFVDKHLELMAEAIRNGRRPATSPLFNGHIFDAHFSNKGTAVWAEVVGRRIISLLDLRRVERDERQFSAAAG